VGRRALEHFVRRPGGPPGQERDQHDPGDDDQLEHLAAGVEHAVEDAGPVEDGTAGFDPVADAVGLQLAGAPHDDVFFYILIKYYYYLKYSSHPFW
jgi:hypothetical protein